MKPDDFLKDHRFFKRPCVEMMSEGERGMQEGEGPRRRKTREPNSLNEATYCQNLVPVFTETFF